MAALRTGHKRRKRRQWNWETSGKLMQACARSGNWEPVLRYRKLYRIDQYRPMRLLRERMEIVSATSDNWEAEGFRPDAPGTPENRADRDYGLAYRVLREKGLAE